MACGGCESAADGIRSVNHPDHPAHAGDLGGSPIDGTCPRTQDGKAETGKIGKTALPDAESNDGQASRRHGRRAVIKNAVQVLAIVAALAVLAFLYVLAWLFDTDEP